MKQLTLRGFDKETERHLRQVARSHRISLNKAALLLLRRGAGLVAESPRADVVGSSLDPLIGTWSEEEERQVLEALESFERVDESLWR